MASPVIFYKKNTWFRKLVLSERLNILGLETLNRRRVIFDLILCYIYLLYMLHVYVTYI